MKQNTKQKIKRSLNPLVVVFIHAAHINWAAGFYACLVKCTLAKNHVFINSVSDRCRKVASGFDVVIGVSNVKVMPIGWL